MCVSMDCKQSVEVEIIGVHFWSEESCDSVDIGILVFGRVKGALVILQKKFQWQELPYHSMAFGGRHQNHNVGNQTIVFPHFARPAKLTGHWKRNTFRLASVCPTHLLFQHRSSFSRRKYSWILSHVWGQSFADRAGKFIVEGNASQD